MSTHMNDSDRPIKGWTPDTLFEIMQEVDRRYEQQFIAQTEALAAADKRYEQRFIAQEGAVQSALTAQEKAVSAALIAADRAVTKVEVSNEKRFESVNEFRAQLADQAAGFLPRNEAQIVFAGLNEKIDTLRLARENVTGKGLGIRESIGYLIAAGSIVALLWKTAH